MLDAKITELADRLIQIQFRERSKQLDNDILLAQNDAAMRGMGTSSVMVETVYNLCARDIELRGLIVWHNLRRVLMQAGIVLSDTLADDLKTGVGRYSDAILAEAHGYLMKFTKAIGIGRRSTLTEAHEQALEKVYAEIDFFVIGVTRLESQSQAPIQLNISGNVGAVMTGPNASANVSQTIGDADREALMKALEIVRAQLDRVESLPAHPKEEIVELIAEACAEAGKPKPNGTKLRSALTDISTAIQTVGSLNDAYQLLKTALIPFGISLL